MLTRMNKFGRVAACGTISNYNRDDDLIGLKNFYVSGLIGPTSGTRAEADEECRK